MKISLSPKELDFKPFPGAARFSDFFTVEKSRVPPISRPRRRLPAGETNHFFCLPLLDIVFTPKCHRAASSEPVVSFLSSLPSPERTFSFPLPLPSGTSKLGFLCFPSQTPSPLPLTPPAACVHSDQLKVLPCSSRPDLCFFLCSSF